MEVKTFLESQTRPVIILHHETPANFHYMKRAMSSSNVTALTEFQISQYQVRYQLMIIYNCRIHDFIVIVYLIFRFACGQPW